MLSLSCFYSVLLGIVLHKSNAASNADLQKLCAGQRYGMLVPNPNDCNSFYVCQFVVQLTKCDIGLHFDRRNKVCNWPQFAGCDWVKPEGSTSEEIVLPVRPDKPNTNDDRYPVGPAVDINKPLPAEEIPSLPSEEDNNGEKPSDDSGKPIEEQKPSEEVDDVVQPTEDKDPEDGQSSKEPEEPKPDNVTENDFITPNPQYPVVDPSNPSEENHNNQPNLPSTDDDVTPNPSPADNQDNQQNLPSTDDDMVIVDIQTPSNQPNFPPATVDDMITPTQTPPVNSAEHGDHNPDLPKPNHPQQPLTPPISEETDQQPPEGTQDSSEKLPPIEGDKPENQIPPHIDENVNEPGAEGSADLPTAGGQSSHHWNIIASIVSVESSHTDGGIINHPTVGAHSPETGYPVDAMTGYDPNNVQCVHSGFYFLPHPSSCQKYFICAYRHLHLHSCGDNVIWNHKQEHCDIKGYARCYSRHAESEDITTELATPFVDYQTRKTTKLPTRKPTSKNTKLPGTTQSHKLTICPATQQVYLPNLDDCQKYYICIVGKAVLTSCPRGMHWDAVGEFCGLPSVVRCVHR